MIDVEPLIRLELDRAVPLPGEERGDWRDVLRRAGVMRRRARRLVTAFAVLAAGMLALGATPLGGAVLRTVEGFSAWLSSEPGTPADESEQRRVWERWPERPELRELLRTRVSEVDYVLYGFRAGETLCLRLTIRGVPGSGPVASCLPRHELERSRDLVIPVKGNVSFGHVGPLPRKAGDPPTVPVAIATFGFAAGEAVHVDAITDDGRSPAVVSNGAFLAVADRPTRGAWIRRVVARGLDGRAVSVPISVQVSGEGPLRTGLSARGPARVDRVVRGGTIGWFVRREPRGEAVAGIRALPDCCRFFARVIRPAEGDFLGMIVSERSLFPQGNIPRRFRPHGPNLVCSALLTRGGIGGGCAPMSRLFATGPLALSSGFSGAGQQFWIVSGLVSDDVTHLDLFLGTGERRPVRLRDNVVIERIQRAKFPARVVGYDSEGRVIGVLTISGA